MAKGSVRSDSGRLAYGSGKPVLGRKFCSRCGKWRHLVDFHVDERKHGIAIRFKHICKTCFRLYEREMYEDPAHRARKREYQRMYLASKRREMGIPERKRSLENQRDPAPSGQDLVPNEPLRERFKELERSRGLTLRQVATQLGWTYESDGKTHADDRRLSRILGMEPWGKKKNGKAYSQCSTNMRYENAVMLAEVLNMDPVDAGV